jgi:thiol-disulfide isomerase/thioredoxin
MFILLAACSPTQAEDAGQIQKTAPSPTRDTSQVSQAAPAAAAAATRSSLPDRGPAPELENQVWINTDQPLRLQDLRGKVVLLEMWTFGCINCRNVIPYVRGWHEKYAQQGLVVIGNHYPEFGYEKELENLKEAVQRLDVPYPVAQDNDGKTWNAYGNRYWPTAYLIDKRGHIRFVQIGEGSYERTEAAIQELLAETYE